MQINGWGAVYIAKFDFNLLFLIYFDYFYKIKITINPLFSEVWSHFWFHNFWFLILRLFSCDCLPALKRVLLRDLDPPGGYAFKSSFNVLSKASLNFWEFVCPISLTLPTSNKISLSVISSISILSSIKPL